MLIASKRKCNISTDQFIQTLSEIETGEIYLNNWDKEYGWYKTGYTVQKINTLKVDGLSK